MRTIVAAITVALAAGCVLGRLWPQRWAEDPAARPVRGAPRRWNAASPPIREFVAYVRANEPGTLRIHAQSAEVKKFAGILYPACLAPVEFIDYEQLVSNS